MDSEQIEDLFTTSTPEMEQSKGRKQEEEKENFIRENFLFVSFGTFHIESM